MGKAKIIPANTKTLLLPYQKAWVEDTSLIKVCEKSRQIGFSWATSYGIVRRKAVNSARLDAWVSSRDDIQARLFLDDCKAFAKVLKAAATDLGQVVIDTDRDIKTYKLRFANGIAINSMSSNPDAQAGKRGDRVLDEFALHKDPKKLYDIAEPGVTWGGQFEILSTHRGSKNFFNALIREIREGGNPKKASLHRVTLQDALDQGFLWKLQSKLSSADPRQEMDEADYFNYVKSRASSDEAFLQEYMCVPMDDNAYFVDSEILAACEYDQRDTWEKPLDTCKGELYMGVDVGRKHDLTVCWICERIGTRFETRKIITMRNTPFSEQKKVIWSLLKLENLRRACFDATGLGMQLAEEALQVFTAYKVEPVTFGAQIKEAMAYRLRNAMEARDFKLPFDIAIRDDFTAVKKEVTAAGNIRFSADRGPGGHADRFWAASLALEAGYNIVPPLMAYPALREKPKKNDVADDDDLPRTPAAELMEVL